MPSSNPFFTPQSSSDDVYFGQDMTTCLTDVVNDKANSSHTHSDYALTTHTHSSYASQSDLDLLEDVVDTKANVSHTHSEYAAASHTHSGYATTVALDELSETVANKANASHNHNNLYYTETEVDTKLAAKANSSHTHTGVYDEDGAAASALTSANSYTDSKISTLVGTGVSTSYNTIGKISSALEENQDEIDLLNSTISTKANTTDLTSHTGNKTNPHGVTKSQIGLSNVPNVTTNDQTPTYSDTTNFTTLTSGEKLSVAFAKIKLAITNLVSHISNSSNPHGVTKSQVGLGNVDNTSDINKPISTATQTALDTKQNTITGGASTITFSNLTSGRVLTSNNSGKVVASDVTSTELGYLDGVTANVQTQLNSKANSSHTHNYAGSSSAGGAAISADKLNANAGSSSQPVYFKNGVPVATNYTLNASVPSGAKFTDTIYNNATLTSPGLMSIDDKVQLNNGGIPIISATSTDGVTYTATVPNYTGFTIGRRITIVPNMNSASVYVNLNVNGLGNKPIRMPNAYNTTVGVPAFVENWMVKDKPVTLTWDGRYWKTDLSRAEANSIYGTIKITGGGTGADNAADARANLDVYSKAEVDALIASITNG